MFLITITQNQIQERFNHVKYNIDQVKIGSLIGTIATDNFLSQYFKDENGFSIIESPLINKPEVKNIILSEIIFSKKKNELAVFKNTQSGRPIYYHINSKGEFYCSTHISMLRKAGVVIEENKDVLPEFFVYRYVTPPHTLYKDINQLSNGSKLYIEQINGQCMIESEDKYNPFSVQFDNYKECVSIEESIKEVGNNLSESLNLLNPVKDRLSVLLSGGLDSSILFAICKDNFHIRNSYSTSYPFELANSDIEKKYALSAAEAFESDHYFYETDTNKYLHGFLNSISAAEEPINHLQSVMFHLMFKDGIPKNNNIVLSGIGADGVFGTKMHYDIFKWSNQKVIYSLLSKYPLSLIVNAGIKTIRKGGSVINRMEVAKSNSKQLNDPSNLIYSLANYGSEDWVCDYFKVRRNDIIDNRYEAIKQFSTNSIYDIISMLGIISGGSSITQSIWSKIAEDKGKIIYYPFTNSELLNYAFSIKWETKLNKPKNILRGVARNLNIPNFIIERKKSGFGISPNKWANKGGVFDPLIPLASKCFDKDLILNIQSTEPKKAMTFWNILNYSIWKRLCIDNEPLDILHEELSKSISDNNY